MRAARVSDFLAVAIHSRMARLAEQGKGVPVSACAGGRDQALRARRGASQSFACPPSADPDLESIQP